MAPEIPSPPVVRRLAERARRSLERNRSEARERSAPPGSPGSLESPLQAVRGPRVPSVGAHRWRQSAGGGARVRFVVEKRHGEGPAAEFSSRLEGLIEDHGGEVVDNGSRPDMVVSVGGDGTMLGAVRRALAWDVPVLGFNLGTMGFLAQAEPGEAQTVVARVIAGDYRVEERMTVSATFDGNTATGVNDVVVEKVDSTRLISVDVTIDDQQFINYRADGLIVATPTGSTAYSFSAGGPLVDPRLEVLVMTPVAAHSLFDRALVLPATSVIRLRVTRDRSVRAHVDKTPLGELGEDQMVEIRRGERPARFVALGEGGFPTLIKDKFEYPW